MRPRRYCLGIVIWQDPVLFPTPTLLVIPLTTQMAASRIPGTLLIQPSATNGLSKPSLALVFQLGALDMTFIDDQPIGHLDDADLQRVQAMAKQLQKLP